MEEGRGFQQKSSYPEILTNVGSMRPDELIERQSELYVLTNPALVEY